MLGTRRTGFLLAVFVAGGAAVTVAWLALGPRHEESHCEPVEFDQAETARIHFVEEYIARGNPGSEIQGVGIGQQGDRYILSVITLTNASIRDLPSCFENVPVRYNRGGPFSAD
ncbi:hypothetical protein GCM10009675_51760 [Prauserella alba]|uniref:Uncharacterized protein n=1 Tax=Prauserella alba TaxID=176898 RepID=A0ABP4GJR2_9PSEU